MKALTVRQPWAALIISGRKRIENRTWRTSYRGPLLIHAGISRADLGALGRADPRDADLDFGALIGVAHLVDVVPLAAVRSWPFAEGPWCWILRNPRPLARPIPMRGQLFLWNVNVEVKMKSGRLIAVND